jgi:hypothetical protein
MTIVITHKTEISLDRRIAFEKEAIKIIGEADKLCLKI